MTTTTPQRQGFRVGDVCEVVGAKTNEQFNGRECTVMSLQFPSPVDGVPVHLVAFADGDQRRCEPKCLRLRRPPSWDSWLYDVSGVTDTAPRAERVGTCVKESAT